MRRQETEWDTFSLSPVYPEPYLFLVVGISGEL